MAVRLGELLVKAGMISPRDLDEALNSQVIFGGKLGTNLLEMGCLRENDLTRFLSKVAGVPAVNQEQMTAIPPDIIALIPPTIADKYKVIPLSLTQRRLTLAMSDPTDFAAIDEIAFATGFIIIPMVASEAAIERCLEKYYEIKRSRRSHYIKGKGRQREKEPEREKIEELPENTGATSEEPIIIEFPPIEEFEGFNVGEGQADPSRTGADTDAAHPDLSPETYSAGLARAADRDGVVELLLSYIGKTGDRAAVFIVKGGSIRGWKMISNRHIDDLRGLEVPLETASVLQQVVQEKSHYLGPLADNAGNRQFIAAMGGSQPSVALLVPLQLLKRVIAILYMEGSVSSLGENLVEIQRAASKATMALEILILKNKIMMT